MDASFVLVDIETNGGSGERGRVIEVAALKMHDGKIIDRFETLINPGGPIPKWITSLTGINSGDLVDAPYFSDIAYQLYEFIEGSIFVAHNVLFDYSFLKREFLASGYTFTPKLFCTVKMSRALYPEHKGHSLQKIIERHGLSPNARHRAADDAQMMFDFIQLALHQKGQAAFEKNLALQLKTRSLPPNVSEQSILSLPESAGVYIFEDDAGAPLYVGKSVNIRSRVRSHFTNATAIAKEMRMSLQSHNVTYIQTETEIEALLLESAKIKELQPIFNRKLRRKKTQHILVKSIDSLGYLVFRIESTDLSQYSNLHDVYGVFTSKNQAKNKLEEITHSYQLCPKLLGLEKTNGACFRRQLGLCRGACTQDEPPESYNPRTEMALERTKLDAWPYRGKVAIPISATRSLLVDQWVPQQIYDRSTDTFTALDNNFDIDTYKIIRSFIRTHNPPISQAPNP